MRAKFERQLMFVDCETTYTEAGDDKGEIVELAIVDLEGKALLNRRIQPLHIETASPEALEINGYDPALWEHDGVPFSAIAAEVFGLVYESTIVAHHAGFDASFLTYELRRYGFSYEATQRISYYTIDTYTLIHHHLMPPLQRGTLREACEALDISNDGAHTALADAHRAREVFFKLDARIGKSHING